MKKLIIFLLIPLFLLNGQVSELGKIPALFSHFDDHKATDADLTVTDFLAMHYFDDDLNDSDDEKDNSLPFKKPQGGEEIPAFFFVFAFSEFKSSAVLKESRLPLPDYQNHYSEDFGGKDAQPPRRG